MFQEVKYESEINNITILKELKLFFENNEHRCSKSPNLERCYNDVLEAHEAILVYDEEERVYKLWINVNDGPVESRDAIQTLAGIIASLEVNSQNVQRNPPSSATTPTYGQAQNQNASQYNMFGLVNHGGNMQFGNGNIQNIIIDGSVHVPVLDKTDLDLKEMQALTRLKEDYSVPEYATITGVFGVPLKLEGQYINLQILCTDLKTKKTEEGKESKELAETKRDEKYKDARMASVEDLFGDKRAVKAENLFKPTRELFDDKELETVKDVNESPRLLLVQGRAGIGKTTFVHYVAHQWSKGQLYANYTWVFTLTLRKLRLLPNTSALSLAEWIWQSQFSSWSPEEFTAAEFKALWRERIEPAIKQNQVLLILDGYDEVPERHPCGAILDGLLHLRGIYENLSLLVTSRPFNVKGITERRRNLEIIGFTDENISQYIQTYFLETHDKTLANILIETLRKQPIIWANSHIPLNLNLLCGIMEDIIKETNTQGLNQALMQLSSMTRLYQMMEKKLYERFFVKHDIDSPSEERELMVESNDFIEDYEEQRLFLGELAFQSFEIGEIIISREIVRTALRAYVNKVAKQDTEKNNPKEKITLGETFFKTVRRLGLIKPILDKSGLSKTKQDYEFLHLTFHEYYVAIYLAKGFNGVDPTSKAEAEKVISKEKYNPRWQIVWWFVAGLLRENTPIYKAYLQQLQDQCSGQTLTQDILQHYQLGLSVRCVDEGFQPNNQRVIEPIVTQLQLSFLKLYQTAKNVTNNDCDALKKLAFINSPFFSACRISPNLCMSERQDLYALILERIRSEDKRFLLEWIGSIRIMTPKVLDILLELLVDENKDIRSFAARAVSKLGGVAATPEVLDALVGLLESSDDVCIIAAEALSGLGPVAATPRVLDALAKLFANASTSIYDVSAKAAAKAVGKLDAAARPQILQVIMGLLMDEERNASITELVPALGSAAATPEILSQLSWMMYRNANAQCMAASAVGELGVVAATPQILDGLRFMLAENRHDMRLDDNNDENQDVRSFAIRALKKLGTTAITSETLDTLRKLLVHDNDDDYGVCSSAVWAVSELGAAVATPEILDALTSLLGDSSMRSDVVKALSNLGVVVTIPKVVDELFGLLSDESSRVRSDVARALGNLSTVATIPKIVDGLFELLSDESSDVRDSAGVALIKLVAVPASKIIDKLTRLFADMPSRMPSNLRYALSDLGPAATPQLLEFLTELLGNMNYDASVRSDIAHTISSTWGAMAATPKILDALVVLLTDEDRSMRYSVHCSAVYALSNLGNAAAIPKVMDALLALLADEKHWVDVCVAHAVAYTLVKLDAAGTPKILDALARLLTYTDASVRRCAAEAMGKIGSAVATPKLLDVLVMLLTDKDESVRWCAAKTLNKLSNAAVPAVFLDWLLGSSIVNNDGMWRIFEMRIIETIFKLMPSFWLENINHPNILAFVSYVLAAAYLNSHISCQINFDKEGVSVGYCVQGFIEKLNYRFLITEAQAQILHRLSFLVIEQLSKTGRLDVVALKKHLSEQETTAQNLSLRNQRSISRESGNLIMHLPGNLDEQKGYMPQYQQSSRSAGATRANRDGKEVKNTCRIS